MKTSRRKFLSIFMVMMLLVTPILSAQVVGAFSFGGLAKSVFSVSNVRKYALLVWLAWITNSAARHYSTYLKEYVLINPNPLNSEVMRVMGFFISLAMAFYALAIPLTGFYFFFVSSSAKGRAQAKYTLGKLILGMFFVSISPYLLHLFFQFSGSLTEAILDQADIGIVTDEFNRVLWSGYWGSAVLMAPGLFGLVTPGGLAGLEVIGELPMTTMGRLLAGVKFVGEAGAVSLAIYPYFLVVVMVLLTFGLLAGRYLTVMIWTILFPIAIFFTSFELTKNIGRVMMEQTLQWTLLQVFYAMTLVAISIGLVILPEGYKEYAMFLTTLHSVAVVAILFMGPWYLASLLQKLFPP